MTRAGCEAPTSATTNIRGHFRREAGAVLRAEFDDCEVSVGPGATTLRLEIPDQGALYGLLNRIASFGLELTDVSLVAPPADVRHEDFHLPTGSIQASEGNDYDRGIAG